jgi:hypothetical protein
MVIPIILDDYARWVLCVLRHSRAFRGDGFEQASVTEESSSDFNLVFGKRPRRANSKDRQNSNTCPYIVVRYEINPPHERI